MPNNKYSIIFILVILSATLPVQMPAETGSKFQATFHVDYFSPQQDVYKDLYGSNQFPVNLRLGYMFMKRIMIFTGIRYLNSKGETAATTPSYFDESYTSKLTIISIPVGINWFLGSGKFVPFIGYGGYYHNYKETWDTLDVSYKGTKFSFFAQAGFQWRLRDRMSLLFQGSYTTLPTGVDTIITNGINLGGMAAGLGLVYRF